MYILYFHNFQLNFFSFLPPKNMMIFTFSFFFFFFGHTIQLVGSQLGCLHPLGYFYNSAMNMVYKQKFEFPLSIIFLCIQKCSCWIMHSSIFNFLSNHHNFFITTIPLYIYTTSTQSVPVFSTLSPVIFLFLFLNFYPYVCEVVCLTELTM